MKSRTAGQPESNALIPVPVKAAGRLEVLFGGETIPAVLVIIGVALFAFDDFSTLRKIGGGFLASPSWVPLLVATAMLFRRTVLGRDRPVLISLGVIWLYGLALTLVTIPFLPSSVHGEGIISKSIRLLLTIAVMLSMVVAGFILTRRLRKFVLVGAIAALAIMVITGALAHFGVSAIENWSVLHSSPNFQMRVRGTRFEASSLGGGILIIGALVALLVGHRRGLGILVVCGVLALAVPQSRGTTVVAASVIALSLIWLLIGGVIGRTRRWIVACLAVIGVIIALVLSLGIDLILSSQWWTDIGLSNSAGSTSDATRAAWSSVSVLTLMDYPFGMGYAAYLSWLPQLLSETATQLSRSFPASALLELRTTISATSDNTLSAKTLPAVLITYFGWCGLVATAVLFFAAIRRGIVFGSRGNLAVLPVSITVILVSATYLWSVFSWDQMFLFGAILLGLAPHTTFPLDLTLREELRGWRGRFKRDR